MVELKANQNTSSVVNCVVGDGGSVDKGSWEEATLIVRWLWIYFLSFFNQQKQRQCDFHLHGQLGEGRRRLGIKWKLSYTFIILNFAKEMKSVIGCLIVNGPWWATAGPAYAAAGA